MNRKKINIISASIVLLFFASWVIWGLISKHNLDTNHQMIIGTINGYSYGGKGNAGIMTVDFTFSLDSKNYSGSSSYEGTLFKSEDFKRYFVGKSFPVLYYTNNPRYSIILLTPNSFKRFRMSFPDSLDWVLKYIK